jgi:hypothetical protein
MCYLPLVNCPRTMGREVQPRAGSLPTCSISAGFPSVLNEKGVCLEIPDVTFEIERMKMRIDSILVNVIVKVIKTCSRAVHWGFSPGFGEIPEIPTESRKDWPRWLQIERGNHHPGAASVLDSRI